MLKEASNNRTRRPVIHGGITTTARLLGERMEDLALHLLGAPNKKLSTRDELRFGNKGSTSVTSPVSGTTTRRPQAAARWS